MTEKQTIAELTREQIERQPVTPRDALKFLLEVWVDQRNNPPESRAYESGAWETALNEAAAALSTKEADVHVAGGTESAARQVSELVATLDALDVARKAAGALAEASLDDADIDASIDADREFDDAVLNAYPQLRAAIGSTSPETRPDGCTPSSKSDMGRR